MQRKIPEWHCAEREKFQTWFYRVEEAWNGNQCWSFFVVVVVCFDSSLGNLGRPFRPFFFSFHPSHDCSVFDGITGSYRSWIWQHWLTDHTVHVSTTTQPYSKPNTVNRGQRGVKKGKRGGKEGEEDNRKWNTSSPTPTFVIDVYIISPPTITTDILTVF